jgi:hypothetical protein
MRTQAYCPVPMDDFFKHNPNCFQITQPGRSNVTPPYQWRRRHIITVCSLIYNPDVNVPCCYTVKKVSDFTVYFLCFLVWVFQDVFLSSENSHHCCSTMRKIREILNTRKKLQQFLVYCIGSVLANKKDSTVCYGPDRPRLFM